MTPEQVGIAIRMIADGVDADHSPSRVAAVYDISLLVDAMSGEPRHAGLLDSLKSRMRGVKRSLTGTKGEKEVQQHIDLMRKAKRGVSRLSRDVRTMKLTDVINEAEYYRVFSAMLPLRDDEMPQGISKNLRNFLRCNESGKLYGKAWSVDDLWSGSKSWSMKDRRGLVDLMHDADRIIDSRITAIERELDYEPGQDTDRDSPADEDSPPSRRPRRPAPGDEHEHDPEPDAVADADDYKPTRRPRRPSKDAKPEAESAPEPEAESAPEPEAESAPGPEPEHDRPAEEGHAGGASPMQQILRALHEKVEPEQGDKAVADAMSVFRWAYGELHSRHQSEILSLMEQYAERERNGVVAWACDIIRKELA